MNGPRIIALREALGWSQKHLASVLSVELVTVKRWERALHVPRGFDDPALANVHQPVKGLAREVLLGIERAVYECGGDRALIKKVAMRLDLGIGAMIAHGIDDLVAGRGRMPEGDGSG